MTNAVNSNATTSSEAIGFFGCREVFRWNIQLVNGTNEIIENVVWNASGTYKSIALTIVSSVLFWLLPSLIARDGRRPGDCIECGYDLRHSTTSQCPECGSIDSRKQQ